MGTQLFTSPKPTESVMISMAATSTDFTVLLSLTLLLFVSFSPFPPAASSTDVPLSVSAKAAAVQYWNRVVVSDSPPPSVLLAHVPSISPLGIITNLNELGLVSVRDFKSYANIRSVTGEGAQKKEGDNSLLYFAYRGSDGAGCIQAQGDENNNIYSASQAQGDENTNIYSASQAQGDENTNIYSASQAQGDENTNIYSASQAQGDENENTNIYSASQAQGDENTNIYSASQAQGDENTNIYSADGGSDQARQRNSHNEAHGIFFRESQLREGATMLIADYGSQMPHLGFLPRYVASRIPMSTDAIRNLFHIPADAPMGKAIASTIDHCNTAPVKGETMRCITSAEDMIDYVATSLGATSRITARSTDSSIRRGGNILLGEVKAANGGKLGHVVSCHQATFPYLLYRCHNVPKTKLYELEILDPETRETVSAATAICHFDTSVWSPSHVTFTTLGFEQGLEVCHWVFPGAMAWNAAAE